MSGLEKVLIGAVGAIVALISAYIIGRKDGERNAVQKEREQTLNNVQKAHDIDVLCHDELVRVYDKHE